MVTLKQFVHFHVILPGCALTAQSSAGRAVWRFPRYCAYVSFNDLRLHVICCQQHPLLADLTIRLPYSATEARVMRQLPLVYLLYRW